MGKITRIFIIFLFIGYCKSGFAQSLVKVGVEMSPGTVHGIGGNKQYSGIIGQSFSFNKKQGNFYVTNGETVPILTFTGIDEVLNEQWEMQVYPIPTSGVLNMKCKSESNKHFRIEIFNSVGAKMDLSSIGEAKYLDFATIDISSFQGTGIYFLKLSSVESNYSKTFKIIKTN